MTERDVQPARRRAVPAEDLLLTKPPDYADAYEIRRCEQDPRPAEEWVRRGLEQGPWVLRRIVLIAQRRLLGLQVGSRSSPGHVLGWRIETSTPAVVRLEASSPLMRGVIIGRKVHPAGFVLTTLLFYQRPGPARAVWAVVAPVHRRVALYLLRRAAEAHACTPTSD